MEVHIKNYIVKFILVSSFTLVGCDDNEEPYSCTNNVAPALTIEIIDKETGDYIACNARAVIEDNGFSEEVTSLDYGGCDNSLILQGAYERGGVYNVHIYKEGYLDWSIYNIPVTENKCHVNTVHIIAALEK